MKVIDSILREWSYRCSDGIVDINDPEKVKILFEVLKPILKEDIDDDILNLLSGKDIPTKEKILTYLQKLDKGESGEEIQQIKNEVSPKDFKIIYDKIIPFLEKKGIPDKEILALISTFVLKDEEEDLIKYYKSNHQFNVNSNASIFKTPIEGGLKKETLESVYALLKGASSKTRGVGKEEYFLAAFYSNVEKKNKGDLIIDNNEYEVKGVNSMIIPLFLNRGIKLNVVGFLQEKIIEKLKISENKKKEIIDLFNKKERWLYTLSKIYKEYPNKPEFFQLIQKALYDKYKINISENMLENSELLVKEITKHLIKESGIKEKILFVSPEGLIKVYNTLDEITKAVEKNEINITGFSDFAPRLTFNNPKEDISKQEDGQTSINFQKEPEPTEDNVQEGAKVDFENDTPIDITISSKPIEGEQLITVSGTRVTNEYDVYYSLESSPDASNIKKSEDALKYHADKIDEGELKELISKTLKNRLAKVNYIGFLESKGTLNNMLLKVIKEMYSVPDENVVFVEKMEYKFIDNAVDWDLFNKASKRIQDDIINFLEKTSQKSGPYKIRKSGEIQSIILRHLHSKYNLGLNPNEPDRPLPPIYNAIVDCITNQKTLLIIDDNTHTGTDFLKIFRAIDGLIEKMKKESSKPSEEEQNALAELPNIINNPKFKTSSFLQDKYKELNTIVKYYKERELIVNKQYGKSIDNIFGYVLYKLKDTDLTR